MTPRIVILGGAGAMGRITAKDLRRFGRGAVEGVVADRDVAAARKLGLPAVAADVTDPAGLARALRGAAVVIASLPYRFNLAAMEGALAAGAHYVDLGGLFHVTRRQLALGPRFRRAGLMAILGMGSAPGIVNVLAAHAAEGLDEVREVHCLVGSTDRTRYKVSPVLGFGYSPDTLIDEFSKPAAVFRGGRFAMVPPLDPAERRLERFPRPVGAIEVDATLHSEVATLPRFFAARGVREVTFRQGFDAGFLDRLGAIVRLGLAAEAPLPGLRVAPRAVLLELLARQPRPVPEGVPRRYEVLRAVVRGSRGSKAVTAIADCHAGPEAGSGLGPDIDTGAPPAIAALALATGALPVRPGVHAPEDVIDPVPFFRELARRGMSVRRRRQAGRNYSSLAQRKPTNSRTASFGSTARSEARGRSSAGE